MDRPPLSPTPRSTIRRVSSRAINDRDALDAVLDEGLVCHLAFVHDGVPVVLPMGYGRDGDTLYLHGSTGARSLRIAEGTAVCVAVTLLDAVVYARSVFHFSMNYRSAVIYAPVQQVVEESERLRGLAVIVEHMAPGSWSYARRPNRRELAATAVIALDLTESSVKIRAGEPADEPEDIATGTVWAGLLPLRSIWNKPEPAGNLPSEVDVPEHILRRCGVGR